MNQKADNSLLPVVKYFLRYRKPPRISPGPIKLRKHFLGGLYLEGLIFGGAYIWQVICVKSLRGAYIWKGVLV